MIVDAQIDEAIDRILGMVGLPEGDALVFPEATCEQILAMQPSPEAVSGEGEELLGSYQPMSSPGVVTLEWRNIGSFFWHVVLRLHQERRVIRRQDLRPLCMLAVHKTYWHEIFHHVADVARHLFGGAFDRDSEEPLAVASSYLKMTAIRQHGGDAGIRGLDLELFGAFRSRIFVFNAWPYSRWGDYKLRASFVEGLVEYFRPPDVDTLIRNGVKAGEILWSVQQSVGEAPAVDVRLSPP